MINFDIRDKGLLSESELQTLLIKEWDKGAFPNQLTVTQEQKDFINNWPLHSLRGPADSVKYEVENITGSKEAEVVRLVVKGEQEE
jgi:hypothetical protein